MPYNECSLTTEISALFPRYPPRMRSWVFPPAVEDFKTLQHVCWIIYRKTNTDLGRQIIGREWDTDPFNVLANIHGRSIGGYDKQPSGKWIARPTGAPVGEFNTAPDARGNVLKMDRWHPTMNDCWVLGGIHRGAEFKLVSPRVPANIWNPDGFPIVTAREILGLLHFGYEVRRERSEVLFVRRDAALANASSVTDYWNFMEEKTKQGAALVRELLDKDLKADLNEQIRTFDRSTLHKVGSNHA